MLGIFQPIFGALVILGIAVAFSTNRRAIDWTTVAWGLSLQIVFALIVLKTTIGQTVFTTLGYYITKMLAATFSDSAPLAFMTRCIRTANIRTTICITPK